MCCQNNQTEFSWTSYVFLFHILKNLITCKIKPLTSSSQCCRKLIAASIHMFEVIAICLLQYSVTIYKIIYCQHTLLNSYSYWFSVSLSLYHTNEHNGFCQTRLMPYVQNQLQNTLQLRNKRTNKVQSSTSSVWNFMIKTHVLCT